MNNDSLIKKNFLWNTVGSTVLSFTSLFFMIIATRINGADIAGVFTFAFSFACVVQVIANYSGRSYQVTNNDDSVDYSSFVYTRIITNFAMIIFCVVYLLFTQYSFEKNLVIWSLIVMRLMESIQDVFYGVFQKEEQLYKVGISMLVKGLLSVFAFWIVDWFTSNILISCISIFGSYLFVFLIYDLQVLRKLKFKFTTLSFAPIKKILLGGFSVFAFTFLTQYIMNACKFAIDAVLPDNLQTIYGILIMPATLVVLLSQLVVQPLMTQFSNYVKVKQWNNLNKLTLKTVAAVAGLGVLAVIAAGIVGIPVLEIIYGLQLSAYLLDLCLIIIGATVFGIAYTISSSLIALRKNSVQVVIYVIASLVAFASSAYFVSVFNIDGAVYSYVLTMTILVVLYIFYYGYSIRKLRNHNVKN